MKNDKFGKNIVKYLLFFKLVVFFEGDLNSMRTNAPRGPVFKDKCKSVISGKLNDKN